MRTRHTPNWYHGATMSLTRSVWASASLVGAELRRTFYVGLSLPTVALAQVNKLFGQAFLCSPPAVGYLKKFYCMHLFGLEVCLQSPQHF